MQIKVAKAEMVAAVAVVIAAEVLAAAMAAATVVVTEAEALVEMAALAAAAETAAMPAEAAVVETVAMAELADLVAQAETRAAAANPEMVETAAVMAAVAEATATAATVIATQLLQTDPRPAVTIPSYLLWQIFSGSVRENPTNRKIRALVTTKFATAAAAVITNTIALATTFNGLAQRMQRHMLRKTVLAIHATLTCALLSSVPHNSRPQEC